jgi:hypothetical protein
MSDWKLFVIVAAIGLGVFYLRNYVRVKAQNLAQKEDLKDLTNIVERVRTQFERANLVHKVQFEAEFRACQDLWRDAQNAHKKFVRLFPTWGAGPEADQRTKFVNAQLAFADTLDGSRAFVNDAIWEAFLEFENSIIFWKHDEMPKENVKESRDAARLSLDHCAAEIKKRFSQLLVV